MITKQSTGAHIIRFLSTIFMVLGLIACTSTPEPKPEPPPAPEPVAVVEPAAPEPPPVIRPDYPDRYTVRKGDTLWDIAKRFLKDPWLWPEVWHINPAVRNPHLIYPGDVIVLYYVDGKPYLTMDGAAAVPKYRKPEIKSIKLSPKIRSESLEKAITTIPREILAPFLSRPRVATEQELEDAPYIISSYDQHLISGSGNKIYANGFKKGVLGAYHVVRPGMEYVDPDSGDVLGYQLVDLADARVVRSGNPTSLIVNSAKQEVLNGDVLFPHENIKLDFRFFPRPPKDKVEGSIISVKSGASLIGQYDIVVLNKGKKHGLAPGHVLAIYQDGVEVRDPKGSWLWNTVKLPDERAGVLMVFSVKDRLSFGLIMEASRNIHINDRVVNP
jgi:hypothetical protein